MIEYDLDDEHAILEVRPKSALDKEDFAELATTVDPQIEAKWRPRRPHPQCAVIPGVGQFRAMVTHFRFVRDHHKHVKKIAVVTDSHLGDVAEHLTSHFVSAKIRHFPAEQLEQARQWIIDGA